MFLPFRAHFGFPGDISRFMHDVKLPSSDPRSYHPALLSVMYLIACSLSGGGYMATFEGVFLGRVRQELESSLAYADRLTHFMVASNVLGMYYARAGRLVEAYNTVSATVRFAVGCGLHLAILRGPLGRPGVVDGPILPKADAFESEERHALWCSIYLADRVLSRAAGFPSSVPDEVRQRSAHGGAKLMVMSRSVYPDDGTFSLWKTSTLYDARVLDKLILMILLYRDNWSQRPAHRAKYLSVNQACLTSPTTLLPNFS